MPDFGAFIRQLQQPVRGQIDADEYFSVFITASIETSWKRWLGGRIVSLITVVGSSGFFWFAIALLFIAAWWKKKNHAAQKMAEWDEEESVYAVLDEVEGPPGDPEDYMPDRTPYEEAYEDDDEREW